MPCAVHEVLQAIGACDEGVLEVVGRVDDAVEGAHLVHVAVLPRETGAGEDEEHLFGGAV